MSTCCSPMSSLASQERACDIECQGTIQRRLTLLEHHHSSPVYNRIFHRCACWPLVFNLCLLAFGLSCGRLVVGLQLPSRLSQLCVLLDVTLGDATDFGSFANRKRQNAAYAKATGRKCTTPVLYFNPALNLLLQAHQPIHHRRGTGNLGPWTCLNEGLNHGGNRQGQPQEQRPGNRRPKRQEIVLLSLVQML